MAGAGELFAVVRRYGPPYDPAQPLERQREWEEHRVYMNALEAEGLARLAGPMEGTGEVLLVFRAADAATVERRLAEDPWSKSGILTTVRVARWNLRVGAVG